MDGQPPTIGRVDPRALTDTRLSLHYAALVLGSAAHSMRAPADDDSHTALRFERERARLGTLALDEDERFRLTLDLRTFALSFVNEKGETLSRLPLTGQTLTGAMAWAAAECVRLFDSCKPIVRRKYRAFRHTASVKGLRSTRSPKNTSRSSRALFQLGHDAIDGHLGPERERVPILTWPHHFDMAALRVLDRDGDGKITRSIGLGVSPGDRHIREPYFYVGPWPHPDASKLGAPLKVGRWHDDGFVGAVLPAGDLARAGNQREILGNFYDEAVQTSKSLLAAS